MAQGFNKEEVLGCFKSEFQSLFNNAAELLEFVEYGNCISLNAQELQFMPIPIPGLARQGMFAAAAAAAADDGGEQALYHP